MTGYVSLGTNEIEEALAFYLDRSG